MSDTNDETKGVVIEFPKANDLDEAPRRFATTATPEQMLEHCVGKLIEIHASLAALAIALGERDPAFAAKYQQSRSEFLKFFVERFQQTFPPSGE